MTDVTPSASGLRRLGMPVVVVAAESGGRRSCSTSTAMYGSLEPPSVVVSLARRSTTAQLVLAAGRFSLSVLSGVQGDVAVAAGRRAAGPDKFAALGIPVDEPDDDFGCPSVAGVLVAWCCRVRTTADVGDHTVVVAEIDAVRAPGDPGGPLIRFERAYHLLGPAVVADDQRGYPL